MFTNIVVYSKEFVSQGSVCVLRLQAFGFSVQEVGPLGVQSDQFPSDKSS